MDNTMHSQTLRSRANECLAVSDFTAARELLGQLAQLTPNDPGVWHQLGWTSAQLGDVQSAISQYKKAAGLAPQSIESHYDLAMVLGQSGNLTQASRHLGQVVHLDPGHIDALVKLAYIDYVRGNIQEAMSHLQKARTINPGHLELNLRMGTIYLAMNDFNKARNCFKAILRQDPEHEEAINQLASIHAYSGDTVKAYQMLSPLLQSRPVNISAANTLATFCRPLGRCQEATKLLEERLTEGPLSPEDECRICFTLGDLYDGAQKYGKAFEHYDRGNRLSDSPYDPWEEKQWIRDITARLNADFFKQIEPAKHISKRIQPVFIVGLPRSGTSLTEQILSRHLAVYAAGERLEIPQFALSVCKDIDSQQPYPFCLSGIDRNSLNGMAKQYIKKVAMQAERTTKIVTDKMPDNYQHLALIQLLFPKARIIHCIRDPMDTCLSCYFKKLMGHPYSYNLINLGRHYRLYEELMAHWKSVLSLPMMEIRYEALVTDPETVSRAMVEFCGLKWSSRCLDFHKSKRNVVTASTDQVRQPIYNKSVARWKNYEEYLGDLRAALDQRI